MNMFEIAKDAWQALGAGKVVANPAAWKAKQVSVNQVAAALGALLVLAKAFGYDLHMDTGTEVYIAGGIYGVVNWLLTVVTTDKIGIMGQRADVAVVGGDGAAGRSPAGVGAALGAPMGSQPAVAPAPAKMWPGGPAQDPSNIGGPGG